MIADNILITVKTNFFCPSLTTFLLSYCVRGCISLLTLHDWQNHCNGLNWKLQVLDKLVYTMELTYYLHFYFMDLIDAPFYMPVCLGHSIKI